MKVLGVDPSSSCTGVALVTDGKLVMTDVWQPPKNESPATKLMGYFNWLSWLVDGHRPDIALVELVAVHRNMNTVRVLARYEAASIIALKLAGVTTLQGRVSEARKAVFGQGNLAKEEVFKLVKKKESAHQWRAANRGGMDEADAYVLASAALSIAEGA